MRRGDKLVLGSAAAGYSMVMATGEWTGSSTGTRATAIRGSTSPRACWRAAVGRAWRARDAASRRRRRASPGGGAPVCPSAAAGRSRRRAPPPGAPADTGPGLFEQSLAASGGDAKSDPAAAAAPPFTLNGYVRGDVFVGKVPGARAAR